jgi:hypothetical protein
MMNKRRKDRGEKFDPPLSNHDTLIGIMCAISLTVALALTGRVEMLTNPIYWDFIGNILN